jgi:hypothetical protein
MIEKMGIEPLRIALCFSIAVDKIYPPEDIGFKPNRIVNYSTPIVKIWRG